MAAATIHPSASFDEDRAAEALERAMRGFGTDKQKVIDILVRINNAQRQMIRTPYKVRYGKDLEYELKRELSGDLEEVIVALMQTPTKRDVLDLQKAVKGFGTNERVLIEILASRTSDEIRAIRNTFYTTFDKSLEEAVGSDTSGDFRRLLLILIDGLRDEYAPTQYHKAMQAAQAIMRVSDKRSGQDRLDAFKALATESPSQVLYIITEYESISGQPIEKAIEHEYSADAKNLLLKIYQYTQLSEVFCVPAEVLMNPRMRLDCTVALVMVARSKPKFFAHQIYNAIKFPARVYSKYELLPPSADHMYAVGRRGVSVRDRDLIRVLVSRSEIDLAAIQQEYERLFKKPLQQVIRDECKGAYRDALLSILKGNKSLY